MSEKSGQGILQSHSDNSPEISLRLEEIKQRIIAQGDSQLGSVKEKLSILKQLTEFEYGRFLIQHGGINGRWSHFLFYEFPLLQKAGNSFHPLELMMFTSKGMESNRERIPLTQSLLSQKLQDGNAILAVPCGVMAEIMTMNLNSWKNLRIVGVDLDSESIALAKTFANDRKLNHSVEFHQRDAWNLGFDGQFNYIVSLGLNMYCQSNESALNLYKSLYSSLKAGGELLISFLTPTGGPGCERDLSMIGPTEKKLIPMISEMLELKYVSHLNSSNQIMENLKLAGFKKVTCHYSTFRALNIAIAEK